MQINQTLTLANILPEQVISHQKPNNLRMDLFDESNVNQPILSDSKPQEPVVQVKGCINQQSLKTLLLHNQLMIQIGVDEAGRGPLLGSVMIGAVILPPELSGELENMDLSNTPISKLNDSKKISEKKRDDLYAVIPSVALGYVSVELPATIIDKINILQASLQGMRIAVNTLIEHLILAIKPVDAKILFEILFDGNKLPPFTQQDYQRWQSLGIAMNDVVMRAVVKGDSKYASIASASVIAKVERDCQMYEMAKIYPDYGIENHKGYPTKAHIQAINQYGVLPEHRRSFAPIKAKIKDIS